ncbi:MAG: tRNA cyclic N6-threonylcarbamoyladenosine(37) synthase TcdA [Gammaproteobacteria bacterium]|nr:tRNA cyclic N6-threonylcarbamoyladenosine(37) synthase TcdA [Gammaproteobacteria bacterium]
MVSDDFFQRFDGIRRLYGVDGAEHIRRSHFCVVGIGGVGSWVVEALARSGVGAITFIDHDDIALSNTNRQLHTLSSTVERAKSEVMAERVLEINPACRVNAIDDLLSERNIERYISQKFDYVIDAIDSIRHKAALIYYCKRNKIPVITTGGAGGITDPTRIEIVDLSRTHNDPLAAKVRAKLRSDYGWSRNPKSRFGVDCVFSAEQHKYPKEDGSVCQRKPGVAGATLDCNMGYGSATFVTASFGFVAVSRAIDKLIAKKRREAKA